MDDLSRKTPADLADLQKLILKDNTYPRESQDLASGFKKQQEVKARWEVWRSETGRRM